MNKITVGGPINYLREFHCKIEEEIFYKDFHKKFHLREVRDSLLSTTTVRARVPRALSSLRQKHCHRKEGKNSYLELTHHRYNLNGGES